MESNYSFVEGCYRYCHAGYRSHKLSEPAVKRLDEFNQSVKGTFYQVGVRHVADEFRPLVLENIGLTFPRIQHNADFFVGAAGRVRNLVQHLGVHIIVFDECVELVGTELAAKVGFQTCQFCLAQKAVFICLGKACDSLHRIYKSSGSLCSLHRVLCINPEGVIEAVYLILCPRNTVFDFRLGVADDVQNQCAKSRRSLCAGLLGNCCDRAECCHEFINGHIRHRCNVRNNREAFSHLLNGSGIVVFNLVGFVENIVEFFNIALHLVRRIGRKNELVRNIRGHVADELRLRCQLCHVF